MANQTQAIDRYNMLLTHDQLADLGWEVDTLEDGYGLRAHDRLSSASMSIRFMGNDCEISDITIYDNTKDQYEYDATDVILSRNAWPATYEYDALFYQVRARADSGQYGPRAEVWPDHQHAQSLLRLLGWDSPVRHHNDVLAQAQVPEMVLIGLEYTSAGRLATVVVENAQGKYSYTYDPHFDLPKPTQAHGLIEDHNKHMESSPRSMRKLSMAQAQDQLTSLGWHVTGGQPLTLMASFDGVIYLHLIFEHGGELFKLMRVLDRLPPMTTVMTTLVWTQIDALPDPVSAANLLSSAMV